MQFLKSCTDKVRQLMTSILDDSVIIKPLFIGSGIFYDGFMFAIYINNAFHLKATGKLAEKLIENGAIPWVYAIRKERDTEPTYYRLPDIIYNDPIFLQKFVLLSINQMKAQKLLDELKQLSSIRKLPNLSVKHERALEKIGIPTVQKLKAIGAIQAFILLKKSGRDINISWFWAMLAALENKHVHVLTKEERENAFHKLNQALKKANMRAIRDAALYDNRADRP
ncbi:regulator of competence-specific genes [Pasteurella langaaensis DSM 22999]|uniref:Regulator of competence-specific genes n=1 Tax=Alitibacter langaaensis DSM 22999 TaxID=1122935 RepID=A0A2U0T6F7_9PAST|nr:TfoX/Sxy family DNA transformation protein [Pasteurella langaaensis]PVX39183.1 regulator of competence-specific genes [Pasteurella langaaensis DSM 22999]